uniref:anthranilate synthase component II n=1 Tax=Catenella fusiformis TaxID=3024791 RepID=UPI0027D9E9E4|nr:anthranilate synthase component II [Catenella fusiformis]WCH57428.1 anthranilate synthase component II [Catenella fusiformis]
MILVIDNYDSFTQNLVQYIGELGFEMYISRNDEISVQEVSLLSPTHIILSPGPGSPNDTCVSLQLIREYGHRVPILGVCLGHQSIGHVYGGYIKQLSNPVHGKTSKIFHNNTDLFNDLPNPFIAARYHSLIVDCGSLPQELEITAWTDNNIIMAFRHKHYRLVRGIQFHPESLWTYNGKIIIQNFLLA